MAKVLLTGGAGFIGSHLVDALIDDGHDVSVIDNLSTGLRENVDERAAFHHVDTRDARAVQRVFEDERPQIVQHLAAQAAVRVSTEDPAYDAECNIIGSLNVLQAFRKTGGQRFIFVSSGGAVYGDAEELPIKESTPAAPICPYGVSKYAVEVYLQAADAERGLDYVILRYANVYGPRQDPHGEAGVIAIFTNLMTAGKQPSIFGDGEGTRDYIYVSDVVRANLAAMRAPAHAVYNVGTGVQTTVNRLFAVLADEIGFTNEPIHTAPSPGEVRHTALDCARLTADTGWRPEFDLVAGIKDTVEWLRARA